MFATIGEPTCAPDVSQANEAREDRPAQSRTLREAPPGGNEHAGKRRKRTNIRSSRDRRVSLLRVTDIRTPRTISTFSSDIAYSDSPAASRASSRVAYSRPREIFPSRIAQTAA
jgi:hypothetical protein